MRFQSWETDGCHFPFSLMMSQVCDGGLLVEKDHLVSVRVYLRCTCSTENAFTAQVWPLPSDQRLRRVRQVKNQGPQKSWEINFKERVINGAKSAERSELQGGLQRHN